MSVSSCAVEHALAMASHHRHHQPAGRVDGHAHVVVLLDDDVLARLVERRIEHRELPQRRDAGLDHEGKHRQLEPLLLGLGGLRLAESLEVRDVGLVELRDVRNRDPVAVQVGTRQLLDARKRLALHRAELGEVDFRPGRQIERQDAARFCSAWSWGLCKSAFDERLHVRVKNASLRPAALDLVQVDAELARELAHRRAGVRIRADFFLRLPRHRARRGRGCRRGHARRRPGRRLRRCGRR